MFFTISLFISSVPIIYESVRIWDVQYERGYIKTVDNLDTTPL